MIAATNAATVYLSKWSESKSDTYRTMKSALERVAQVLDGDGATAESFAWHAMRYEDARSLTAALQDEDLAPATINKMLSAVRGVLETAWRLGLMPDEVYRRIDIENVPGSGVRAGRALTAVELDAIATALQLSGPRDAAMVAVLAGAGLRRVELVRLTGSNYDPASGRLTAMGKRNKKRSIPVGDRWRPAIEMWWRTMATPRDLLFDLDGKNPRRAVSYVVETFCKRHELPTFTPHDLRRTFGTHVEKVAGISMAQKLLGHENIQTTALYVRIDEEREHAAVKDL